VSRPTSGVDHIQISEKPDGSFEIIRNNLERYTGTASESHYKGLMEYHFSGLVMTETISINRYTGLLEINLKSKSNAGLMHLGTCKISSKKF
jgi:hypothetical protein